MTEYVILRAVNDNGWIEEKRVTARSSRSAIRTLADGDLKHASEKAAAGRFVAVPARSWQPVTVTVETKTQLRFQ